MTPRLTSANVIVASFYCLLSACAANADPQKTCGGTVVYQDSSPAAGAVVYVLEGTRPLEVINNRIMIAEHLKRAITDEQGRFTLDGMPGQRAFFFARDLEDHCGLAAVNFKGAEFTAIVIEKPACVKGRLLKGDEPVKGQKVTASYLGGVSLLRYSHTAVTDHNGVFAFDGVLPGKYDVQVIQEVPQVGCSFNSVVTKHLSVTLQPGEQMAVKLGGTALPFLRGKITDAGGKGLHGVWVRLESKKKDQTGAVSRAPAVVWSDVTERDGGYRIFDIPAGEYKLHCFRRLALDDYKRTLQAEKDVVIRDKRADSESTVGRSENICDVSVDIEPFMPLKYDELAPAVSATLLNGEAFNLSDCRGRIVVLYFYSTWCAMCAKTVPKFDSLADRFGRDKVVVLGISLDNNISEARQFVSQKNIRHLQLFDGPWQESRLRKAYHVVDVPTSFVIDTEGKIAQIDLFGATLENFISEHLGGRGGSSF